MPATSVAQGLTLIAPQTYVNPAPATAKSVPMRKPAPSAKAHFHWIKAGVASPAAREASSTVKRKSARNAQRIAKGAPIRASATSANHHSSQLMGGARLVLRAHTSGLLKLTLAFRDVGEGLLAVAVKLPPVPSAYPSPKEAPLLLSRNAFPVAITALNVTRIRAQSAGNLTSSLLRKREILTAIVRLNSIQMEIPVTYLITRVLLIR